MNDAEKRRRKLLEQMRKLYRDGTTVPAVHPRYRAAYDQLYKEDYKMQKGALGLRTSVSILIFFIYIAMGFSGRSILGITNIQVLENIMQNFI